MENEQCKYCKGACIKNGKCGNGKQRYKCKACNSTFIKTYSYTAYTAETNNWIIQLTKEGCGIRSIARLLHISVNTVLKRLLLIAKQINKPQLALNKEYEVDELCTFCKNKINRLWVVLAYRRDKKLVVDYAIGKRTIKTISKITETLLLSLPKKIYTDKLNLYRTLIPQKIHDTKQYGTNHVERENLNIRTCLKRLFRRTICFSRSIQMLNAVLKIHFWSSNNLSV